MAVIGALSSKALPASQGWPLALAAPCRSAGQVDADGEAEHGLKRLIGRQVGAAALQGHDQFDLVMQIAGRRRIGDLALQRGHRVGGLAEEERRIAAVSAHLAGMGGVVAPHAENPANGEGRARSLHRNRRNGVRGKGVGRHGASFRPKSRCPKPLCGSNSAGEPQEPQSGRCLEIPRLNPWLKRSFTCPDRRRRVMSAVG
jgi:hypothetical protein